MSCFRQIGLALGIWVAVARAGEENPSGLRDHAWGATRLAAAPDGGAATLWLEVRAWPTNGVLRVLGVTRPPLAVELPDAPRAPLRWLQSDWWLEVRAPATGAPPARVAVRLAEPPGLVRLDALPDARQALDFDLSAAAPASGPRVLHAAVRQTGRYAVNLRLAPDTHARLKVQGAEVPLEAAGGEGEAGRFSGFVEIPSSGLLRVELEPVEPSAEPVALRGLRLQPAPAKAGR